jgi:RNA polymerase sigma-70 factor (ECF subfamily)
MNRRPDTVAGSLAGTAASATDWDQESCGWVDDLASTGPARDDAVAHLHALMLRVARTEAHRRSGWHGIRGPELDDIAHQAADDAVVSILRKVDDFRGESRFSTWVCAFAIREVSTKFGRHVWRRDGVRLDDDAWDKMSSGAGDSPESVAEAREVMRVVRDAVMHALTEHQRRVFVAIVVTGTPLDALVVEMGTNRNAIYKTLFDARRKVRAHLEAQGLLDVDGDGR